MKKIIIGIVLLVVLLAGAHYAISINRTAPAETTPATSGKKAVPVISWQFKEVPEKDGMPQSEVSIMANGQTTVVGTFTGSCSEIVGERFTDANEYYGATCWFAGGGNEIGVFLENDQFVVKVGDVDEGTAESPGFRGNFVTKFEIK